ncbi:hypothetical protein [Pedobacter rhizosphaerae]|uniref:Uncharacterized protein n=1 Tax=Pedobacter rhizosphaerae TaxID=390241 RepID=A0A1H9VGB3_9SPHI|nr:hypothetical protein [Pedobacter rhizosphaerae]SES20277.1 hypothetical protein SAMN04488023_14220 [Pedobacter rhizosphaerae]
MNKTLVITILSFVFYFVHTHSVSAQIPDSLRYRAQQGQYRLLLRTDILTARKVAEIEGRYRDSISLVLERLDLDAPAKHSLMIGLDSMRVEKLKRILTTAQLGRLLKN